MKTLTAPTRPVQVACFYCGDPIADKDAMIVLRTGSVYGPCCADLFTTSAKAVSA
jgi:hypothetical protein